MRIAQGKSAMRMQPWVSHSKEVSAPSGRNELCCKHSQWKEDLIPHLRRGNFLLLLSQGCIRIADLPWAILTPSLRDEI